MCIINIRNKKMRMALLAVFFLVLLGSAYCHIDTQALPKLVDAVSSVIGDNVILWAEKQYYKVTGWTSERVYAGELKFGIEKPHTLSAKPLPSPYFYKEITKKPLSNQARLADIEGNWKDKGSYYITYVYPETNLNSIADVIFFKPKLTTLHLVCGTKDPAPGGVGRIPDTDRKSVVIAFSGGFKYRHDKGGMVLDNKVLRPMRKGMGTLVIFNDSKISVGKWGRDWKRVNPNMRDVRQGFMLIDNGAYCDNPLFDIYSQDKATFVRRSAIGITKHGALVYATGNNLSANGLAKAMMAVGVTSAIHLEMNLSRVICGVPEYKKKELAFVPATPRCCDPRSLSGTRERDFMYVTRK